MSLLPPTPLHKSKEKYDIIRCFAPRDGESQEEKDTYAELKDVVLKRLAPFPLFKHTASFRLLSNGEIIEITDIPSIIEQKTEETDWISDDIDLVMNMYTRLNFRLTDRYKEPGIIRIAIQAKPDNGTSTWSDVMLDEFPINLKTERMDPRTVKYSDKDLAIE